MPSDHYPKWFGYVIAAISVSITTAVLKPLGSHINSTTVALALLLNVLFIATRWGSLPALCASVVAMLCFNFFFLPPFGTLTIAAPDNWIALTAFLVTAITAGSCQRVLRGEPKKQKVVARRSVVCTLSCATHSSAPVTPKPCDRARNSNLPCWMLSPTISEHRSQQLRRRLQLSSTKQNSAWTETNPSYSIVNRA